MAVIEIMAIITIDKINKLYFSKKIWRLYALSFIMQNYYRHRGESKFQALHLCVWKVTIAFQQALQKHFIIENELKMNFDKINAYIAFTKNNKIRLGISISRLFWEFL